ncbi:MAG: hypothetical protein K5795_03775 [Lachnospiraceae bacterium]|nr:hypothetical protein [Lachnospiraceae bacterium]
MGLEKKVLNVTGRDYEDIVLYLSAVLNAAGKKPLIEDMTRDHDLYYCISHIKGVDPAECILDYMGIGYETGILEPSEYFVIIRLHDPDGFTPDGHPTLYVSDEKAYNLMQLVRLKEDPGSILVIKDYTGAVKKKIDSLAEQLKCDRIYTLVPNIPDKKSETLATHNDRYKFNRISPQLKSLISDILAILLPDIPQKDIKRAYKTASGGHIG